MNRLILIAAASVAAFALVFCTVKSTSVASQTSEIRQQVSDHDREIARQHAAINQVADYARYTAPITELPEDSQGWHVTVFTSSNMTQRERQILSWFDQVPDLRKLKQQTHFHHYTPNNGVYSRYANLTSSGLPAIVIQTATGEVMYKASGKHISNEPWPFVEGVRKMLHQRFPHICPGPCPKPTPTPSPDVTPPNDLPPVPDIVGPPDEEEDEEVAPQKDDAIWIAALAGGLCLAAGFVLAWGRSPYRIF